MAKCGRRAWKIEERKRTSLSTTLARAEGLTHPNTPLVGFARCFFQVSHRTEPTRFRGMCALDHNDPQSLTKTLAPHWKTSLLSSHFSLRKRQTTPH